MGQVGARARGFSLIICAFLSLIICAFLSLPSFHHTPNRLARAMSEPSLFARMLGADESPHEPVSTTVNSATAPPSAAPSTPHARPTASVPAPVKSHGARSAAVSHPEM